jgi:hypothetical protein
MKRAHPKLQEIDNLFTSARLLKRLRDLGIGGAGTVRTTKTKREEKETKARDKAKEKETESQVTCTHNSMVIRYLKLM